MDENDNLLVEICNIKSIETHPNANLLDVATIKGWSVVIQKGTFKNGELVLYIPPDAILPESLHTFIGVTQYCAELPSNEGNRPTSRRVKAVRLRGVPSYGVVVSLDTLHNYLNSVKYKGKYNYEEGTNYKDVLDITKWEPPVNINEGDEQREHPDFHNYTKIQRWQNFPGVFEEGDSVVVTEKIHGQSIRLGLIKGDNYSSENIIYQFVAGSHRVRRKEFNKQGDKSLYWQPFEWCPKLKQMLYELWEEYQQPIITFGELYGKGIQKLTYDSPNEQKFLAFDISIGGKYIDYKKYGIFRKYEVSHVPILYSGSYSEQIIKDLTNGPTLLGSTNKFKGREGIVITDAHEQEHIYGRKILKSVSVDYLANT